ncbi:hypothetical protein GOBAR_DD22336 [Gossypium barbadense]|nr:hypothetical protein GOBAR_DD22336 [Gossypium barbadense]
MKELVKDPVERKQKNASPLPYHGWVGPCDDTIHTLATQMEELNKLVWLMLIDSYGLEEESLKMIYKTLVRMMKYMSPSPGEYKSGLHSHTDKPVSTLICEDQISGLEVEAWSNGRLKSVNHRVMMSGDKDRYSIAAFVIPNEGTIIKTPKEFIYDQHPRLFKDFDFMDFFHFAFSDLEKLIDSGE